MRPTFLIKTLLPVLGYLAANQAIANPFEGVEPNKYCLTIMVAGTTPEDERDFGVEGNG